MRAHLQGKLPNSPFGYSEILKSPLTPVANGFHRPSYPRRVPRPPLPPPHPKPPQKRPVLSRWRVSVAGKGGGWSQFLTSLGARRLFPLPASLRLWTQTSELSFSSPFLPRTLGVQDALTLGGKGRPPSRVAKRQRLEQKSGGPSGPLSAPPLASPLFPLSLSSTRPRMGPTWRQRLPPAGDGAEAGRVGMW